MVSVLTVYRKILMHIWAKNCWFWIFIVSVRWYWCFCVIDRSHLWPQMICCILLTSVLGQEASVNMYYGVKAGMQRVLDLHWRDQMTSSLKISLQHRASSLSLIMVMSFEEFQVLCQVSLMLDWFTILWLLLNICTVFIIFNNNWICFLFFNVCFFILAFEAKFCITCVLSGSVYVPEVWLVHVYSLITLFRVLFAVWLQTVSPVWARGRCRISPPRFLAECCKRQLNQGSFVLLYFRLSTFSDLYWVCLSVFSCTVLFVSISQVIGCEDRLRNYLYCVEWGVKLYSNQQTVILTAVVRGAFRLYEMPMATF